MEKVLITYRVSYPGFFSTHVKEVTEIVQKLPEESVGEVVENDFRKWKEFYSETALTIAIIDYKLIN